MSKYNLGFRYVIQEIENFDLGTTIECENGNKYELREAENKQRKFSRKNGTKLRFMTYDNIDKMFRIIENEIDIDSIEEITERMKFNYDVDKYTDNEINNNFYQITELVNKYIDKQNEIVRAVKHLNKEIKSIKEK